MKIPGADKCESPFSLLDQRSLKICLVVVGPCEKFKRKMAGWCRIIFTLDFGLVDSMGGLLTSSNVNGLLTFTRPNSK
jgi:hypothetical protein